MIMIDHDPASESSNVTSASAIARSDDNSNHMQSLSRGLAVIRAFGQGANELSVSQAADRTGLPRAAVRRCLITLVDEGYAVNRGRNFALTPKVLDLGFAYLSSLPLMDFAKLVLDEVVRKTGQTASIAVLDGSDIVFVFVGRLPNQILILNLGIGTRLPAYATAMGRVLLGSLSADELDHVLKLAPLKALTSHTVSSVATVVDAVMQARTSGWSLVDGELDDNLRSLAVPIRDRQGSIIAAINVASHSRNVTTQQMLLEFLPVLQEASTSFANLCSESFASTFPIRQM
jgi:IclR family pca regulon transcriptional regulator